MLTPSRPRARRPAVDVRPVAPDEHEVVSRLLLDVYVGGGFVAATSSYTSVLSDTATRAAAVPVLVAVDAGPSSPPSSPPSALPPRVLGTVTLVPRPSAWGGEVTRADDEAELRLLAVAPAARGRGVAAALVRAAEDLARAQGCRAVHLSSMPSMTAAHRLYEGRGYRRTPERDWAPQPGVDLVTYALPLL